MLWLSYAKHATACTDIHTQTHTYDWITCCNKQNARSPVVCLPHLFRPFDASRSKLNDFEAAGRRRWRTERIGQEERVWWSTLRIVYSGQFAFVYGHCGRQFGWSNDDHKLYPLRSFLFLDLFTRSIGLFQVFLASFFRFDSIAQSRRLSCDRRRREREQIVFSNWFDSTFFSLFSGQIVLINFHFQQLMLNSFFSFFFFTWFVLTVTMI